MKLLHVVVIKKSFRPSINHFPATGHIAVKHSIYIMRENISRDILQFLLWNIKN